MPVPGSAAVETLRKAWVSRRTDLPSALTAVDRFQARYEFPVTAIAKLLETRPALVHIYLAMAGQDPRVIDSVGKQRLPESIWVGLLKLPEKERPTALNLIQEANADVTPFEVLVAFRSRVADARKDLILAIPGNVLMHLSGKAADYSLLWPKARSALNDFGKRRNANRPFNENQLNYLTDLLRRLVKDSILTRSCRKGAKCQLCTEANLSLSAIFPTVPAISKSRSAP
jgi:hypothetical protein